MPATNATPSIQNSDALKTSNWKTKSSFGNEWGNGGGNPPVATVVKLLAMYNIPKVAIKEGIPNLIVIKPFTKPTAIPIDNPNAIANQGGIPWCTNWTIVIGTSAKTDPTDKSNSPEIINIAIPIATMIYSGVIPITIRIFLGLRNLSLAIKKAVIITTNIMNVLISGRINMDFNLLLFI